MKNQNVFFALLGSIAVFSLQPANAQPAQAVFIDTFDSPVYVTGAPDTPDLLFVVEQTGKIKIHNLADETTLARPFLDLTTMISGGGERGVLSIAFARDYPTSRLFYVAFTNPTGDVEVDEFRRSADPTRANAATRRKVISIRHRDAGNHNGGQLQFGPDGYLYISIGDGGATPEAAPDLRLLLGKILRIDPRPNGSRPYTIPSDNPYLGTSNRKEIWSYGLRNPWRFAIEGNRIIIADVGQGQQEEINYLNIGTAKGVNFGWPQYEGRRLHGGVAGPDPAKRPMLAYNHGSTRCAVIGGYTSRDPAIPALQGRYLYGDFCDGVIWSMVPDVPNQTASDLRRIGITAPNLSSIGRGPNNRLYITQTSGELSRIAPRP